MKICQELASEMHFLSRSNFFAYFGIVSLQRLLATSLSNINVTSQHVDYSHNVNFCVWFLEILQFRLSACNFSLNLWTFLQLFNAANWCKRSDYFYANWLFLNSIDILFWCVCPVGCLPLVWGVYPSMQWGRHPPPWTERHLWKHNLRKLRLRAVMILC